MTGRSWTEIHHDELTRLAQQYPATALGAAQDAQAQLAVMQQSDQGFALPRISIYTASKLHHAPLWTRLADEWPEVHFTARWPKLHVDPAGVPRWPDDSPAHGAIFWQHDMEDVCAAQAVLCYAEPGEILRGALVEAGMALGLGRFVITVGENESFGTWQYHRNVLRVKDLSSARNLLHLLAC